MPTAPYSQCGNDFPSVRVNNLRETLLAAATGQHPAIGGENHCMYRSILETWNRHRFLYPINIDNSNATIFLTTCQKPPVRRQAHGSDRVVNTHDPFLSRIDDIPNLYSPIIGRTRQGIACGRYGNTTDVALIAVKLDGKSSHSQVKHSDVPVPATIDKQIAVVGEYWLANEEVVVPLEGVLHLPTRDIPHSDRKFA